MREGFLRSSANSRAFARGRNGVSSWNSIPSQFYQKTFERRPRRPAEFGAVREFMRLYPHIYPALLHDPRSDGSVANVQTRVWWPAGLTELGSSGESEQSCNERDLPRYVAL